MPGRTGRNAPRTCRPSTASRASTLSVSSAVRQSKTVPSNWVPVSRMSTAHPGLSSVSIRIPRSCSQSPSHWQANQAVRNESGAVSATRAVCGTGAESVGHRSPQSARSGGPGPCPGTPLAPPVWRGVGRGGQGSGWEPVPSTRNRLPLGLVQVKAVGIPVSVVSAGR